MTGPTRLDALDTPVWVSWTASCGCRHPFGAGMPTEAYIAIHVGSDVDCEDHGPTLLVKSGMKRVDVPTMWVPYKQIQRSHVVWDWRQRQWVKVVSVDRTDGTLVLVGRRRRVGSWKPDENICVRVLLSALTDEARTWWADRGVDQ